MTGLLWSLVARWNLRIWTDYSSFYHVLDLSTWGEVPTVTCNYRQLKCSLLGNDESLLFSTFVLFSSAAIEVNHMDVYHLIQVKN